MYVKNSIERLLLYLPFNVYLFFIIIYAINKDSNYLIVATIGGLILFIHHLKQIRINFQLLYFLLFVVVFFYLIHSILFNSFNLALLLLLIANFGVTFFVLDFGLNLINIRIYYYSIVLFFCYQIFIVNNQPHNLFVSSSYNYVSVLMLNVTVLLYLSYYTNGKKVPLYPAIITLAICLWGIGRGGIIAAFVLLFGLLLVKKKGKRYIFSAILLITFMIYMIYDIDLDNILQNIGFGKFYKRDFINDEPRFEILMAYLNEINVKSFFFGFDVKNLINIYQTGNLHNSFLNAHSMIGLGAFILFFIGILSVQNSLKKNPTIAVLIITIVIRALTDDILLFEMFDYILFLLIYYSFKNKNSIHFSNKNNRRNLKWIKGVHNA